MSTFFRPCSFIGEGRFFSPLRCNTRAGPWKVGFYIGVGESVLIASLVKVILVGVEGRGIWLGFCYRELANERGTKYQTLINEMLRAFMESHQEAPKGKKPRGRVNADALIQIVDMVQKLNGGKKIPAENFSDLSQRSYSETRKKKKA